MTEKIERYPAYKPDPEVIIFVKGGVVDEVSGVENYALVDYDLIEEGECPVCHDALAGNDDLYCSRCGVNWEDDLSKEDVVKLVAKLDN